MGALNALGINGWALISQIVLFAILFLGLQRWVFPALSKTLDQRANSIREGLANAEKSRQELANAEKRVEAMLAEARQEAQRTLANATQAAEHVRADIEQQAQARSRDILAQTERSIQQQVAQAKAELRASVADLAISAAERVVGQSLDTQSNRRLVNEFVAQAKDSAN